MGSKQQNSQTICRQTKRALASVLDFLSVYGAEGGETRNNLPSRNLLDSIIGTERIPTTVHERTVRRAQCISVFSLKRWYENKIVDEFEYV